MSILIKGGRVVDPANGFDSVADVLIDKGVISAIGQDIPAREEYEIINAEGHLVVPGLVDMHCHLREPGFEYKEDIANGTKSALGGGFTSVACMPNTNPTADNPDTIKYILDKAEQAEAANVFPIGSVTKGLGGKEMTDVEALKSAGAVAISDDGKPVEDSAMMLSAMRKAYQAGVMVISHCEEMSLGKGDMNEGALAESLGYEGISPVAEEIMVARDAILSAQYKLPIHIAHISTRRSVEAIRNAKKKGAPITCETCPHYFSLTEDAVRVSGANAKMNPPLRTNTDVMAIIEGLADGTIDAIATDHAPHSAEEKSADFAKAPNGIIGFETAFALGYTYLVDKGHLTISELVEKMSVNPARILGIDKGSIGVGDIADIAIFDISKSYRVVAEDMLAKSKNTPYDGFDLTGRLLYSIVGGRVALRGGEALWKAYFN